MRHFLFDFDGTITCRELLPEIGRICGAEKEIGELTKLTIAGVTPFQTSLERRVELLDAACLFPTCRKLSKRFQRYEKIVEFIQAHADRCHIVTGNLDAWVGPTCRSLSNSFFCSKARTEGDRLLGLVEALDKSALAQAFPFPFVAIGEGHSDAGMIEIAEIGIAFGLTHEPANSVTEVCSHKIYDEHRLCWFLQQLL